jgi:hypothetical protein
MRTEEVHIGKTEESKRKTILSYLGRQVILDDEHLSLIHALLLKENDSETYYVQIGDFRGKTRLHYHDLQGLIVLYPSIDNPLPQISQKIVEIEKLSPKEMRERVRMSRYMTM